MNNPVIVTTNILETRQWLPQPVSLGVITPPVAARHASAADKHIGCYGLNPVNNWVGEIAIGMAVTSPFTNEEADAISQMIYDYMAIT